MNTDDSLQRPGAHSLFTPAPAPAPPPTPKWTNELSPSSTAKQSEPQMPPWYRHEIGPRLKPSMRVLFQNYLGLVGDALISHLYSVRELAWPVGCIGSWGFLHSSILESPAYPDVLSRVRAGTNLLDLGCGFGQDIRRLATDGAPTEHMYANDVNGELWELGYKLFDDRDRLKARFFQGNILEDTSWLTELDGKIGVILAYQFLHLFSWEKQIQIAKKMVATSKNNTIIMGSQMGKTQAREKLSPRGTMFCHTPQTFQKMWEQVGNETGTTWKVEANMLDLDEWGLQPEDYAWMEKDNRALNFIVQRENGPC